MPKRNQVSLISWVNNSKGCKAGKKDRAVLLSGAKQLLWRCSPRYGSNHQAWVTINLYKTEGITHNGRFKERLNWQLVVRGCYMVVWDYLLGRLRRFSVGQGTFQEFRTRHTYPKGVCCLLVHSCFSPPKNVPTLCSLNLSSFILSCQWVSNDGNIPPVHEPYHLQDLGGSLSLEYCSSMSNFVPGDGSPWLRHCDDSLVT